MNRELKFRFLLQGKPIPYSLEEKDPESCDDCVVDACEKCQSVEEELTKYATPWQYYERIGRYNDVLGYCYHSIGGKFDLQDMIHEIAEEMLFRVKNGEYDIRDHTEALNAFESILRQIRDHDGWLVEIRYE